MREQAERDAAADYQKDPTVELLGYDETPRARWDARPQDPTAILELAERETENQLRAEAWQARLRDALAGANVGAGQLRAAFQASADNFRAAANAIYEVLGHIQWEPNHALGRRPVVASGGLCVPPGGPYNFFQLVGGRRNGRTQGRRQLALWVDEFVRRGRPPEPNRSVLSPTEAIVHPGGWYRLPYAVRLEAPTDDQLSAHARSLIDPRLLIGADEARSCPPRPRGRRWGPPT
jgi:hypothetical protein